MWHALNFLQKIRLALGILLIFFANQACHSKQVVTNPDRDDGFGAQFQTIIYSVIYAESKDLEFVYTPFKKMEHNYDQSPNFLPEKERLINFIDNFAINKGKSLICDAGILIHWFEHNLISCANSPALRKVKEIFRANKNRNHYFNDENFNIAIHIRRHNPHDNRINGTDTPDYIFLNIINKLRIVYAAKKPLFHIYSQGNNENFKKFNAPDLILHLNESVEDTFIPLVLADVLVTSRSSFSYVAAILSEGTVYYMPFWHPPLPGWLWATELLK